MRDLTYDVVVIGAGPVGESVADRASQGGYRYLAYRPARGRRRAVRLSPVPGVVRVTSDVADLRSW